MIPDRVKPGLKVRIIRVGTTDGMTVAPKHLNVRRAGVTGEVKSFVPGHGGDVWFVAHEGSDQVGAYVFDEFEPQTSDHETGKS